jgi:hypothetical protein
MHAQCIESFAGGLAMPAARFVKYFSPCALGHSTFVLGDYTPCQ